MSEQRDKPRWGTFKDLQGHEWPRLPDGQPDKSAMCVRCGFASLTNATSLKPCRGAPTADRRAGP